LVFYCSYSIPRHFASLHNSWAEPVPFPGKEDSLPDRSTNCLVTILTELSPKYRNSVLKTDWGIPRSWSCRLRLKCDGTTAEKNRFYFSAKRMSPFKSAGGRQFSRLFAAEVWASAIIMLDTACTEVV